jgi:glycopeptide antibiotics resistance protein
VKNRLTYIVILLFAGILGYSSRYFADNLPVFIADYAGDTFWAFAVYFFLKSIFPKSKTIKVALISILFSILIEFSQFYHAQWIDSIRETFIGGLVLGFGFHWEDLVCYTAGVLLALSADLILHKNLLFKTKQS